eukprot:m.140827 g.140827  ORF g.140827 m.140827 type:complete len:271 (-) comp13187_c0_seq4:471-1283(-)
MVFGFFFPFLKTFSAVYVQVTSLPSTIAYLKSAELGLKTATIRKWKGPNIHNIGELLLSSKVKVDIRDAHGYNATNGLFLFFDERLVLLTQSRRETEQGYGLALSASPSAVKFVKHKVQDDVIVIFQRRRKQQKENGREEEDDDEHLDEFIAGSRRIKQWHVQFSCLSDVQTWYTLLRNKPLSNIICKKGRASGTQEERDFSSKRLFGNSRRHTLHATSPRKTEGVCEDETNDNLLRIYLYIVFLLHLLVLLGHCIYFSFSFYFCVLILL